ncbi:MAG: hypothetical protein MUC66_05615 [Methanolinea sp.]|jgi:hypothetical protein|nr:hypothetical protein [Methanolinea sp.]
MKEEELDWQVYHMLAGSPERDEQALVALLRCTPQELRESVVRLERAMLLERRPEGIRVLSINEMLLRCQARFDPRCPFSIVGGVIRPKYEREQKDD